MANRYLRATGNWNGSVWASTSSGSAGSAATPTSSDDVFITANFTVTLVADVTVNKINHTNGRINLSTFGLNATYYYAGGSTARTLDLGSGTFTITSVDSSNFVYFNVGGSNMTLIPGTSLLILNCLYGEDGDESYFVTGDKTFNDVQINLGSGTSNSILTLVYGSPIFRSLSIQSKNSMAHTLRLVEVDLIPPIMNAQSFVAKGSSSSNRLTIETDSDPSSTFIAVRDGGSSYGQYVDMKVSADSTGLTNMYIGSNSIQDSGMGWALTNPPKISTLIDDLTVSASSNGNWLDALYSGSTLPSTSSSGLAGGGYLFDNNDGIISFDNYDVYDTSGLVIELPTHSLSSGSFDVAFKMAEQSNQDSYIPDSGVSVGFQVLSSVVRFWHKGYSTSNGGQSDNTVSRSGIKFVKIVLAKSGDNSTATMSYSSDGSSWSTVSGISSSFLTYDLLASSRLFINMGSGAAGSEVLGSINMLPKPNNTGAFFAFF